MQKLDKAENLWRPHDEIRFIKSQLIHMRTEVGAVQADFNKLMDKSGLEGQGSMMPEDLSAEKDNGSEASTCSESRCEVEGAVGKQSTASSHISEHLTVQV